jgi:hypothetical protein
MASMGGAESVISEPRPAEHAPMVVPHSVCSLAADSAEPRRVALMVGQHSVCSLAADLAGSRAVAPMVVPHSVCSLAEGSAGSRAAGSKRVPMAEPARAWEPHLQGFLLGSLLHLELRYLEYSLQALAAACSLVAH